MRSRIFFLAVVSFWLAMNYLLWRSQWGAHSRIGSAVPPEVVWEKVLTAPDTSSLDIYDHEKKIGLCHWMANIGNSPLASNKILADDYAPDGPETQVSGYTLTFEGNATLRDSNRLRFEASLSLSTNRNWQDFHLRASLRPWRWDIEAVAATEKLVVTVENNQGRWQKRLNFSDARDTEAMWSDFGGSGALGWLGLAGLTPPKGWLEQLPGAVQWQAHEDWMQFGHSKARVYRVETALFGRPVYLFASRVGEILWVEFPDKITFRNEAFEHF
jgi:hypothetical protein